MWQIRPTTQSEALLLPTRASCLNEILMAFLHASYSGYFPFCITEEGDVGDNTSNPVGMSLEDAMALYWKPKTFRIVESWNTIAGTGDDSIVTVNGSTDVTLSTEKTKMSESICPPFDTIMTRSGGTFTKINPTAEPPANPVTDTLTLQLFIGEPYVIVQENLYYPNLTFHRLGGGGYWEWVSVGAGGTVSPFYMAELQINGNSYPFQMYSYAAFFATSTNCSSVITIDEERDAE